MYDDKDNLKWRKGNISLLQDSDEIKANERKSRGLVPSVKVREPTTWKKLNAKGSPHEHQQDSHKKERPRNHHWVEKPPCEKKASP